MPRPVRSAPPLAVASSPQDTQAGRRGWYLASVAWAAGHLQEVIGNTDWLGITIRSVCPLHGEAQPLAPRVPVFSFYRSVVVLDRARAVSLGMPRQHFDWLGPILAVTPGVADPMAQVFGFFNSFTMRFGWP